ncbi:hypothetical protein BaRGS_00025251 [Batillaria attramentaria]|uniref:Ig-like domain-containing protein n=1 Tax=Batillaria attramentaria TaxID=370345 RepID=A0ABD0K8Q9_9CAEN
MSYHVLPDPPSGAPVISQSQVAEVGSNTTLTCIVTGGNPRVTSVTFHCEGQGDAEDYFGQGRVSSRVTLGPLNVDDNGTVCVCSAVWPTRPELYSFNTSTAITVLGTLKLTDSIDTCESPINITLGGDTESRTIRFTAYPAPALREAVYVGTNLTAIGSARANGTVRLDPGAFSLHCHPSGVVYQLKCILDADEESTEGAGLYEVTFENPYGDVKVCMNIRFEENFFILYIAIGVGVGAAVLFIVVIVGVVFTVKKRRAVKAPFDGVAARIPATDNGYTGLKDRTKTSTQGQGCSKMQELDDDGLYDAADEIDDQHLNRVASPAVMADSDSAGSYEIVDVHPEIPEDERIYENHVFDDDIYEVPEN